MNDYQSFIARHCDSLARLAHVRYGRNLSQLLYLYYKPAHGPKWGELVLLGEEEEREGFELARSEYVPRHLPYEALYSWIRDAARVLPLIGSGPLPE